MSVYIDERDFKRMRIPGVIQFSRSPAGEYRDAELLNSTNNGLCFHSNCPYLPETPLVVRSKNRKDPVRQHVKVVWSRPTRESSHHNPSYNIGVIFTE